MWKSILMWFKAPIRNYRTNPEIDKFIYKLIAEIENGAEFWATYGGAYIYHVKTKDKQYNLWGTNRFYAYLSRGGDGGYDYENIWEEQMPSRKCCYDFLQCEKKYCKQPEKPNMVQYTNKILSNLP